MQPISGRKVDVVISGRKVDVVIVDDLWTEGAARRQDEHLRFLRMVREWADGADVRLPAAGASQEVRKLIQTFGHLSRQAGVISKESEQYRDRWYYAGKADTWEEAAELLKAALA